MMPAQYHSLAYNPVGLWQFDGDLLDSGPNGYDLSLITGAVRWGEVIPGMRGLYCNSTSVGILLSSAPSLLITGDMTVELLTVNNYAGTAIDAFVECAGSTSSAEIQNQLYSIGTIDDYNRLWYEHEFSTGTDVTFVGESCVVPGGYGRHLAFTRISNVIRFYVDGELAGAPSGTLTAPTGGSAGSLRIGGNNITHFSQSVIASVKILNVGLSAGQIAAEYESTLGSVFPRAV